MNPIKALGSELSQVLKNRLKVGVAEAPKYMQANKELAYKKVQEANKWYTRIIGLDEVKVSQNKVIQLEEKLLAIQDERRRIGQELSDIRKESNSLQDQIHRVKRHEDYQRFLDLMRAETEVLKREQDVVKAFGDCDKYEREIFTAFTSAIRDSHEKQRAQVEYTKYFGLVLGILGSFLTFIYSTYKKYDLKWFLEEKLMVLNSSNYDQSPALMQELQVKVNRLIESQDSHNASVIKTIEGHYKQIQRFLTTGLDYTRSSVSPNPPVLEESTVAVKAALVGAVGLTTIVVLKLWCC